MAHSAINLSSEVIEREMNYVSWVDFFLKRRWVAVGIYFYLKALRSAMKWLCVCSQVSPVT